MKILKLILPVVICFSWAYVMNNAIHVKDLSLPPLGKFFSPFEGFWQNTKESIHEPSINIDQSFSNGKVFFDDRAVPHIQAANLSEAFFIQGYVHALHRLWQMDFSSRAAEGRISEIIGDKALEFDKTKRRKGLAEAAKNSLEAWKKVPEVYQLLEAYSKGVNFYIHQLQYKEYPIEYKLMNFQPEEWSPYKSSLFHKSMAEILCGRDQDVELQNALSFFGQDFNMLFPEMDPLTDPVIPSGTKWGFKLDSMDYKITPESMNEIIPILTDSSASGLGSNNWAISKSKSTSNNPVLCNDPHLSLNLPSVWYEQQIITPDENVYGVSFAGIPGVVIGFNKDIAWGITNAGWDVVDWYKIKWINEDKTSYLLDGKEEKVTYRIERIKIAGKEDFLDTIKICKWGPIVYENDHNPKMGLAMHWIIQDSFNVNELNTFVGLNKAKNYSDYRHAIVNFSYPAQNFAYADRFGNVALTVQGAMPVKSNQQGRFIQDGSLTKNNWKGFLPYEFNPHCLNPKRGFISSANQKSTTNDFPNYYNNGDFRDSRGTMINRLLGQKDHWSIDDLKKLQANNYSLLAETALPFLLNHVDTNTFDEQKLKFYHQLKNWNLEYDSSSTAAVLFDQWLNILHKLTWDEITMDTLVKYTSTPSELTTIRLMKEQPNLKYFDIKSSPEKEDLKKLISISMDSLILVAAQSEHKNWGKYKASHIDHMARIPAFGIPFISTSGSKDIINACWKTWGPSWRMIVELSPTGPIALGVYPGGQDGNPGHEHYMDMVEQWRKSDYYKLQYCTSEQELNSISKNIFQFVKL